MEIIWKSCNAARITRKNNLDLRGHLSEMVGAFLLEFSARFSPKHKKLPQTSHGVSRRNLIANNTKGNEKDGFVVSRLHALCYNGDTETDRTGTENTGYVLCRKEYRGNL
jgi:hypothetical protein